MKTQKFWILTALIATLLTIATHGYLSAQNYRLKSGLADGKSACNISSQFNCDAVALSKYSEVFDIPVAIWGLATNGVMLFLLFILLTGFSMNTLRVAQFNFWLSGLVFATSVVMGAISITQLGTYCLFCIFAYVLSLIQAIAAYQILKLGDNSKAPLKLDLGGAYREQKWLIILIVLVPAFAALGHSMARDAFGRSIPAHLVSESVSFWQTATTNEFNPNEGLSYPANAANAKMVIVEFADFLCPHCKMASLPLHTFTESRTDVRLVFKPFPLDGNCNNSITQKGDSYRCKLSAAALCGESLAQKGWLIHDWIFERQSELASSRWDSDSQQMAAAIGVSPEQLKECVDSPATKELLLRITDEGAKAKIQGTPSIFVNGKKLDAGQFVEVLDAVHKTL